MGILGLLRSTLHIFIFFHVADQTYGIRPGTLSKGAIIEL